MVSVVMRLLLSSPGKWALCLYSQQFFLGNEIPVDFVEEGVFQMKAPSDI